MSDTEVTRHCRPSTACCHLGHTQSIQSETQVEHFLRFITRDLVSQHTAYGPSRIKLESGEELLVPKPIRKMIPARVVMSSST